MGSLRSLQLQGLSRLDTPSALLVRGPGRWLCNKRHHIAMDSGQMRYNATKAFMSFRPKQAQFLQDLETLQGTPNMKCKTMWGLANERHIFIRSREECIEVSIHDSMVNKMVSYRLNTLNLPEFPGHR